MPADFPPLPPDDVVPTIPELAALIAGTFPLAAQAEVTAVLTGEVLPWDLRNLAGHPRKRRLVELVYEGLASALGDDVAQRPARLGDIVCDRRGQKLTQRIHGLAVARHLRGRGGKVPSSANPGDVEPARPFLALSEDDFNAEVARAGVDKQAWEDDARTAHPSCLAAQRIARIHDGFALDSARTGQFGAAAGALYVFLRSVGERPRQIDVH